MSNASTLIAMRIMWSIVSAKAFQASRSLGLLMALSVCALGQGRAREAGTKSDVSGANLSRAKDQCGLARAGQQAKPQRTSVLRTSADQALQKPGSFRLR